MLKFKRDTSRATALLAAVLILATPMLAQGQEPRRDMGEVRPPEAGMVFDAAQDAWRIPTIDEALMILQGGAEEFGEMLGRQSPDELATALLRQELRPMLQAELSALASSLGDLILQDTTEDGSTSRRAGFALKRALRPGSPGGRRYPEAFDVLTGVYEALVARALVRGGTDPLVVLENELAEERRASLGEPIYSAALGALRGGLYDVFWAEPHGRGMAYVRRVFERSTPPRIDNCGVESPEPGAPPPPPSARINRLGARPPTCSTAAS